MDTEKLLEEIELNERRAAVELDAVNPMTRPSLQIMKVEAQERLGLLRKQYFSKVRSNTLAMLVQGSPARVKSFCDLAAEEGVSAVNAQDLYEKLAKKIEPSIGSSREFAANQLQGLIEGLRDFAEEADFKLKGQPRIKDISAVNTRDELVSYIRSVVRDTYGDELLRVSMDRLVNKAALDSKFSESLFPCTVYGLKDYEIAEVAGLFSTCVPVTVGDDNDPDPVNKEYVLRTMTDVRDHVRKSLKRGSTN